MITKSLLKQYRKYAGDLDAWSSVNRNKAELYNDWQLIESLIQNIRIIKRSLASEDFIAETNKSLERNCESKEVRDELYQMA